MPLSFNIVLETLVTAIIEAKELKEIQTGKELKLSPFAGDMILYIHSPKDATGKLLELINEFDEVVGHKFIHRNLLHFYTLKMKD